MIETPVPEQKSEKICENRNALPPPPPDSGLACCKNVLAKQVLAAAAASRLYSRAR